MTTYHRTHAVPQVSCVGNYCNEVNVPMIMCKNMGSNGIDAQWYL